MIPRPLEQDSQKRIQLIKQTDPEVFPVGGQPVVMTSLSLKRQTPDQARTSFRHTGFNARAWGALLRHFETFSGDVSPDYKQINVLLEMLCGAPVETIANRTVGGVTTAVRTRQFYFPESLLPALVHYAIENGYVNGCKRMLFSLMPSFGINVKRGNAPSISGSATLMFNKPLKALDGTENFDMSGAVAQNSVYTLGSANVSGDVVLSVKVGAAAAENVTLSPGDNAASIEAKILAQTTTITAVVVTGAINGGSGGANLLNRAGWTMSASSFFYTYTVSSVLDGDPESIWAANLPDQHMTVDFGAVIPFAGYRFGNRSNDPNSRPRAWSVYTSNTGAFAGEEVLLHSVSNESSASPTVEKMVAGTARYVRFLFTEVNGSGYVTIGELDFLPAPSSATSNTTIEFTGPANTPVTVAKVSGANYTIAQTQAASDGNFVKPQQFPMLPQHFSYRKADELADLAASAPLKGVHETDLQVSNVVEPDQVFDEGQIGYQNFVGGDVEFKAKVVLVSDELMPDSDCRVFMAEGEEAPAKAAWHGVQANHPDGLHSFGYQGRFAAGDPYAPSAGGKVFQYEFPLDLELNNELKAPNGQPAILRFVTTEPVG